MEPVLQPLPINVGANALPSGFSRELNAESGFGFRFPNTMSRVSYSQFVLPEPVHLAVYNSSPTLVSEQNQVLAQVAWLRILATRLKHDDDWLVTVIRNEPLQKLFAPAAHEVSRAKMATETT
jgi:hypothetical protein